MVEVMNMRTLYVLKNPGEDPKTLSIDEQDRRVYVDGRECALTRQEYSLLQELAQHTDAAVSRENILRNAWGFLAMGETRTVDVHVQRLRRKLGRDALETVYRIGYRLCAEAV